MSRVVGRPRREKGRISAKQSPLQKQAVEPHPDKAPPAAELVSGLYRKQDLQVFHCSQCFALLGDSLTLCGEDADLACIICLRVTEEVRMEKRLVFDVEGALAGSYLFESKKTVPASEVKFCCGSLKSEFAEMKVNLVEVYIGLRILTSRHELKTEEALKVESAKEQGKMATGEKKMKNSPDGPGTGAVLCG